MKSNDEIVNVDELDIIFLSYSEPQKEEFWLKLKNSAPWAKRVDGIKGSDNAHKAAAMVSETERFILVDGDNIIDESFLDEHLVINDSNRNAQFRWRAKNYINGLYYGNGGVSSWTRQFVMNMRTHENSDGDAKTNIEFCFDPNYWPMHNCYSTTYPNYSPKQAFIAGFREGVKMCGRDGIMPKNKHEFKSHLWPRNLQNLIIWQTIGRDVENGFWAIHGARVGTHYLMTDGWDYREVQDFECLNKIWEIHKDDTESLSVDYMNELNRNLGLNLVELNPPQSRFFKDHISRGWRNKNIMLREIDVIRKVEGW